MTKRTPGAPVPLPQEQATLDLWPETADILRLSKSAIYEAARCGQVPTIRIGRRLLVPTAALRRLLLMNDADDEPTLSTEDGKQAV